MSLPPILAHGALGPYDELIYLGIALVFVVMMGISWLKSRNQQPDFEDEEPADSPTTTEASDRFRLD